MHTLDRAGRENAPARITRGANGALRIAGAAWSDGTPIRAVELRIDDGPWQAARITPNRDNPYAWTFWSYDWADAKPGEHSISSRATDARGRVQPAPDDPFIALKKTRWENNQQAVRKVRI